MNVLGQPIDKKGAIIIPVIYQEIRNNTIEYIAAKKQKKWGFIDYKIENKT